MFCCWEAFGIEQIFGAKSKAFADPSIVGHIDRAKDAVVHHSVARTKVAVVDLEEI